MNYSKEEFNSVWKDTSKENILNQFYYEHIELQQVLQRIDKALKIIETEKKIMGYAVHDSCLLLIEKELKGSDEE